MSVQVEVKDANGFTTGFVAVGTLTEREQFLQARDLREGETSRETTGLVRSYRMNGNWDIFRDGKYLFTYWTG